MDAVTGARPVLPVGGAGVVGPDPHTARALLARALVSVEGPWRVGWWEGCAAGVVYAGEALALAEYDGPEALADELRVMVATARDKGEGAALCGSHFRGDRRTLAELVRWEAVQIDCEPPKGAPEVSTPLALGWGILGDVLPVDAVAHPSPSARHEGPDGGDAVRWRAWVRVLPVDGDGRGVDPWAVAGAKALRWCLAHCGLAPIDPVPLAPQSVGWVHPRGGVGLAPEAVRWRGTGAAVDLAALGVAAVAAGVVARPRGIARGADRWDGAALLALATAAGCEPRAKVSGVYETRCPRGEDHSGGGPGGAALDTRAGWWICQHGHAATPGRRHVDRHPGTPELVSWALPLLPPTEAARLAARLSPAEGPARRALARVADAPARTPPVPRDAAGDALVSRVCEAVSRGAGAVLVRATTGSGKSRAVPQLVSRLAPPPSHDTRDAPQGAHPAAVAVVLAPTHPTRDALALALASDPHEARRRLPVVLKGVTEVRAPGGGPECMHHARAEALEAAGVSVRATLCRDAGGENRNACPRSAVMGGDCPAERGEVDPTTGAAPDPSDPRGRVVVATHASGGGASLAGAVLVLDEACAGPWEASPLDPEALRRARGFAPWIAPRPAGVAAGILVRAMIADPGAMARHAEPGARAAWWRGVGEALAVRVDAGDATQSECEAVATLRRAGRVSRAAAGDDGPQSPTAPEAPASTAAVVLGALEAFVAGSGRWVLGATRPANHGRWKRWREAPGVPGDDGGGRALAAFRAWCAGCEAVPQEGPEDGAGDDDSGALAAPVPTAWVVAVPSAHVVAARRHRGPVVGLDATGSESVWRWIVPRGPHELVRVDVADGGRVDRVVVAHGRATVRAMLAPGAKGRGVHATVRWSALGPSLAAVARTVVGWCAEHAPGQHERPAVALVSRPAVALALALGWALVRSGADPREFSPAALAALHPEALEACRDDTDALAATHRNVVGLLAPGEAREALVSLAAVCGTLAPAWWGGVDARGSNALMGARVFVALGDATVPPAASRLRAACEGSTPEVASEALAAESARQWWGRARTVGRSDDTLQVHSGTHHGWGAEDAPRVVTLDGADVLPRADTAPARAIVPRPVGPGDGPALVHALRAEGWTMKAIADAGGVSIRAVQGWARGDSAPSPEARARVEVLGSTALALGALAGVALRVRAVLWHRRPGDVWTGGKSAPTGLRAMLARAGVGGVDDGPAALRALRDGVDTPGARALALALSAPAPSGRRDDAPWRDGAPPTVLDALERVRPPGAPRVAHELVRVDAPEGLQHEPASAPIGPFAPDPFALGLQPPAPEALEVLPQGRPGPARARPPRPPRRVRATPGPVPIAPADDSPEAVPLGA